MIGDQAIKTLFISAGPKWWGSSRMRAYWPAQYMQDAHVIEWESFRRIPELEAAGGNFIFQKTADPARMRALMEAGGKVYWDVCDPSWWWEPERCQEIAGNVTGVVASNEALAADFSEFAKMPCRVIPDRLEINHYDTQRVHLDIKPVRLIWYGVSVNRISLFAAIANLERLAANGHKIELTIFDNSPQEPFIVSDAFPIYQARWGLEQEGKVIANHDIAVLPPYPGPWGRVKSNNKRLTAYACGLPAVTGEDYGELVRLVSEPKERQRIANAAHDRTMKEYNVRQSAAEWEELLDV